MAEHNDFGKIGEEAAAAFLQRNGYTILARNWRNRKYEIDIVAEIGDIIVFVEVKTRKNKLFATPKDAVTIGKIKNTVMAANAYIEEFEVDLPARFDIIEVIGEGANLEIEHTEDAFVSPIM